MLKEINTINADATVIDAAKIMGTSSYVIVLKKGKPIGIITERDIIVKVLTQDQDPRKVAVTDIMSVPLITIDPDAELTQASQLMRKHNVGKLIVMRDNIIYGVITDLTVMRYFQDYVDRATRDIIRWTPFI